MTTATATATPAGMEPEPEPALPPHGSEVFIGGLPRDITEDDLCELCEPLGEIYEVCSRVTRINPLFFLPSPCYMHEVLMCAVSVR